MVRMCQVHKMGLLL